MAVFALLLPSIGGPQDEPKNAYHLFNERLAKASSLSGKMTVTGSGLPTTQVTEFAYKRPNLTLARSYIDGKLHDIRVSNGKIDRDYSYVDRTLDEWEVFAGEDRFSVMLVGMAAFYTSNPDPPYDTVGQPSLTRFAGRSATAINVIPRRKGGKSKPPVTTLYFDASTGDLLGFFRRHPTMKTAARGRYDNLELNPTLPEDAFEWQPPAGAKPRPDAPPYASLLQAGTKAPLFAAKTTDGTAFSLANSVKNHRLTVLSFWSYT
ncbi:MAG: hypothetical protein WAO58_07335 [Fimbriimonadaceae bacterium]